MQETWLAAQHFHTFTFLTNLRYV